MSDRLFKLLPAFVRTRDAQAGGVLEALTGIVSDELDRVQDNIDQLYDDWFIETCEEWVVPYLGDLLGVQPQYVFDRQSSSLRPFVANTLDLRRRKGTAAMLETLGRSLTGWPTRAVEMFQLLATNQHLNHLRPQATRTPDLRDAAALELLGGAFETAGRLAEVRRIASGRGRYNLTHVALYVWRLLSFAAGSDGDWSRQPLAVADGAAGPGRFRFSPLGHDLPLFAPSATRTADAPGRADEPDYPGPLRRRPLSDELEAARGALASGQTPRLRWFADPDPVVRVRVDGELADIPPAEIQICDLSAWATLPPARTVSLPGGGTLTTRLSIDPVLGRLAFVSGAAPAAVRVTFHHGFSAEMGGGSYDRSFDDETALRRYPVEVVDPTSAADAALQDAMLAWLSDGQPPALFEILDSAAYGVSDLSLPAGGRVVVRAADHQHPILRLSSAWRLTLDAGAAVDLDGLLVAGAPIELEAVNSDPASAVLDHDVSLRHCTLVPGLTLDVTGSPVSPSAASLTSVATSIGRLTVAITQSLTGRIDIEGGLPGYAGVLRAADAIIDGAGGTTAAVRASDAQLDRVTVLGDTAAETLSASDTIFVGRIAVRRTQVGCIRFSYVEPASIVPRCYRCQPALALAEGPPADAALIVARIVPMFTSMRYGQPGYGQLGRTVAAEIATGATDGSEMGAFQQLHQPQREANLRAGLSEYLRIGLEAGIFFVT